VSEELAVPSSRGLVAGSRTGVPVYRPGEMGFTEAIDMDDAWAMISPAVRERVNERAGSVLERWAWLDDDRPSAVVLGTAALVSATPTRSATGRSAHVVETVRLNSESARVATVHEDTAARRSVAGPQAPGAPGASVRLPSNGMRDFLGNLPERAQQLLQEPFVGAAQPPRGDHHYLQTSAASGFGRRDLQVFCYLFDTRWLTCVTGEGVTYGMSFAAARWELTCRRVGVRPK
jgi:hypothetical protein